MNWKAVQESREKADFERERSEETNGERDEEVLVILNKSRSGCDRFFLLFQKKVT